MDDERIIDLFFARSDRAILELSDKYGKIAKKVSFNILRDASDVEECVNDAYLGVWNTVPPQRPNPLLTYLCRIVRNLSIKLYRKNTAKKRNSHYDLVFEELENCFSSSLKVEEEVEAKEVARLIEEFLNGLDKVNRVIFIKRYWFAESVKDIAKSTGMSAHTVTVRLSRLREKLKLYLLESGVAV